MSAPVLTPPQQRFVSAIIAGKTQGQAYLDAGFPGAATASKKVAEKRGRKMAGGARIGGALARARLALTARVELTGDDIVAMLLEARQVALSTDPPQANAAVAAAMGIAKVCGLVIDRAEINHLRNKPSLFPTAQLELSEDEWRRQFDPDFTATSDRT